MKRAATLVFASVFLVIGLFSPLVAQESVPFWVLYDRAVRRLQPGPDQDLSLALQYFSEALERNPIYPEAYAGVARVYLAEGDILLAERYYERALAQIGSLDVPDDEYTIRMEIASLYRDAGDEERYRAQLLRIAQRDPVFSVIGPGQRTSMRERLLEGGINRVLVLYRLSFPQAGLAHFALARLPIDRGDDLVPSETIDHALFAVVQTASEAIDAVIAREPGYQFTSVADLVLTAARYPAVAEYLAEHQFTERVITLSTAVERSDLPGGKKLAELIRREVLTTLPLQR